MISLQKGYEDWKELSEIVSNVKTLNTFVDLVDGNKRYDITNDLRETRKCIDLNYKSICATIVQNKKGLTLSPECVEVWEDKSFNFIFVRDMSEYEKYKVETTDKGEIQITRNGEKKLCHYSINNKVYKENELVCEVNINKDNMTEIDIMILELMGHNS